MVNFKNAAIIDPIPVFLAPMAGVTDAVFRELVSSFGASAVVSEMVSSESLVRRSKKTYTRLIGDNNLPKIVQIVGADPKHMAESAAINEDLGIDAIDINMGCPAKKIVANASGAALLKNEDLAVRIAESVVNAVKIPVSLKMRLGWSARNINCLSLAKKFEDVGVQMLSIHCRTRDQMYSGVADWSAIAELRDILRIPYLCNGDIRTSLDAIAAIRQSRSVGVMVGRAALGRPWLLKQMIDFLHMGTLTAAPALKEQLEIVMLHFRNTLDFYGKKRGIRMFRKHFCWYSHGLRGASAFREKINVSDDVAFIEDYVHDFYHRQNGEV
ncbi:MAG: tRNA dihydrouridine synthase DusB [Holosporaceae bacterium]|jgi:tRNA-dihydrouridine synthase B|nr:tRNA dihydrouridine synthase DusB [Holosporaceae bacterium]